MRLLGWAVLLLVVSIVAGILGFVVHVGFVVTKALCFVALAVAAALWIAHLGRRGRGGAST